MTRLALVILASLAASAPAFAQAAASTPLPAPNALTLLALGLAGLLIGRRVANKRDDDD